MTPGNEFALAVTIDNIIYDSGKDINDTLVEQLVPVVKGIVERRGQSVILKSTDDVFMAKHEDFRTNHHAEDALEAYGITKIKILTGPENKQNIRDEIKKPAHTVLWFNNHGSPDNVWLSMGQDGKDHSNTLSDPDAISYKELSEDLIERAKRNNGKLSDLTIFVDSCYSGNFIRSLLRELVKAKKAGIISDYPTIIAADGLGVVSRQDVFADAIKKFHDDHIIYSQGGLLLIDVQDEIRDTTSIVQLPMIGYDLNNQERTDLNKILGLVKALDFIYGINLPSQRDIVPQVAPINTLPFYVDGSLMKGHIVPGKPLDSLAYNGGIDLSKTTSQLQVQGDSSITQGFFTNEPLFDEKNIKGLFPVIVSMEPVTNWKEFLGS